MKMASKLRKNSVYKSNITTRRTKSSQIVCVRENSNIVSELSSKKKKIHIDSIKKSKLNTDKKPQIKKATKLPRLKKVHKCLVCSKIFKGVY
jgi:hypothetical protein